MAILGRVIQNVAGSSSASAFYKHHSPFTASVHSPVLSVSFPHDLMAPGDKKNKAIKANLYYSS